MAGVERIGDGGAGVSDRGEPAEPLGELSPETPPGALLEAAEPGTETSWRSPLIAGAGGGAISAVG